VAVVQYTFTHKQYTINLGRVRIVPRLCELYPGICLKTEEKALKNKYIESAVRSRNVYLSWREAQFNLWKHLATPQIKIAHLSILDRTQQVDQCIIQNQHFIY